MQNNPQASERQAEVNRLLKQSIGEGSEANAARARARELLGLDELNWSYFFFLYQSKVSGKKAKSLQIFESGKDAGGRWIAYPTAIAPPDLLSSLRKVEYSSLVDAKSGYAQAAKGAALWVKKMQAGSGSSMTRSSYLARRTGTPEGQARIGAKGTDLFVDVADPRDPARKASVSIAEAQVLRSILDFRRGEVGAVIFHDIVSSETEASLRALWERPSLLDPSKTYGQLVEATPGLSHFGRSFQHFIPTLDEQGQVSFNRKAPGGHALFAVDALRAAFDEKLRPRAEGKALVAAISNGEDMSGAPDGAIIGYMVRERAPIALVTTEKTPVDVKGGVVSMLRDDRGGVSLTVLETAQAKEAGQLKLFESLRGSINTNMALFNYDVLAPLLTKEVAEIGEDAFMRVISPDLISNVKEQKDADGATRKYLQLEGAMGSTLMNLDRYWRGKYGQPLVHLIDVDRARRTEFFSPIKSAFDYFMQFHSDRFAFDSASMRLRNLRPGELPQISLTDPASKDKHWQDVENVLEAFAGAGVRGLDELSIEGKVVLRGVTLKGRVRIANQGKDSVDVAAWCARQGGGGRAVLEDTALVFGADGQAERRTA